MVIMKPTAALKPTPKRVKTLKSIMIVWEDLDIVKKIFIEIISLGLVTTHIENLNSIFKETDIKKLYIRGWSRSAWKWL